PGEKAWQTAIREVMEETRIELTEIWSADILEQFYEPDKECITLVPVFVSTVPEDTKVVLNDEHDAYKWASIDEAYELFGFLGQQRALAAIKAEFIYKKPNPHLRIRISTKGPRKVLAGQISKHTENRLWQPQTHPKYFNNLGLP
ncbi:MAG: NUDIX domain-containing protein, partial [Paracoccaceae bacterium]|nr:NUDIX domain-containing protein [Paracoccaceae bacterium]